MNMTILEAAELASKFGPDVPEDIDVALAILRAKTTLDSRLVATPAEIEAQRAEVRRLGEVRDYAATNTYWPAQRELEAAQEKLRRMEGK